MVAGANVLFDLLHAPLERPPGIGGGRNRRVGSAEREGRQLRRIGQPGEERLDSVHRSAVLSTQLGRVSSGSDVCVGYYDRASEGVIDDDRGVADHEQRIGQPEIVLRASGQFFDEADDVVSEVPDSAAAEPRKSVDRYGLERPNASTDVGQRIAARTQRLPPSPWSPAVHFAVPIPPGFAGLGPNEGVPRPALAPDERFEQEGERGAGDRREGDDGGQSVSREFPNDWDDPSAAGQSAVCIERDAEGHRGAATA